MNPEGTERRKNSMFDKDFYDKMMEVHSSVGHIVKWNEAHQKQDDERHKENIVRITALEKSYWKFIGGFAVVAVLGNVIIKMVFK